MSHCGTPSNDHLDHCFVVLKHIQQSFLLRRLDVWGNTVNIIQNVNFPLRSLTLVNDNGSPPSLSSLSRVSWNRNNQIPQIESRQEARPISIQRPKRWFRILLNCVKLKFVSYTSNLLEQMYDFQKYTMFLQKWILNPQDLPKNRSLETIPVCIVLQYYPHNNIVCIHMYDECKKSIDWRVCHKLWSILWWIVQVRSLTMEYQVFQYVPSVSMSEQFESILFIILQQISFLLLWSGGHRCME